MIMTSMLAISCGRHRDSRLERIWATVSDFPRKAMVSLDSIDPATLSERDRAFYNLLTIKARDKAYVTHTSDSLILSVIKYAESHKGEGYYPEALYYGGRVYRDLGDYPTAIDYFQKALDLLPPGTENCVLRGKVLSQTGGLLNDLRLYEEAITYIKESIECDRQAGDSVGMVYDLQLLGATYMRANKLKSADSCLHIALARARHLPPSHVAKSRMYLAGVKRKLEQIDSALFYIRNTLDVVKPLARNSVLAHGALIYQQASIYDTAYIYADELIYSADITNKKIGYEVIFSDPVRQYVPADSLIKYACDYHASIEHTFDEHGAQQAIMQRTAYNYQLHQRERKRAEEVVMTQKNWIMGFVILLLICMVVILWLKNRNKRNILQLRAALSNVTRLEESLNALNCKKEGSIPEVTPVNPKETAEELREKLREKLLRIYESNAGEEPGVPREILESDAYRQLQNMISGERELKADDPLWDELDEVVGRCYPNFRTHLQLLVGGKLSSFDLHTCLLIKCGVSTARMASLVGRASSTITSRRGDLSRRIYGENLGSSTITGIIRLL